MSQFWRGPIGGGGTGNVTGPGSSTDNAIVRWDGTTGTLIQNSTVIIDDDGNIDSQNTFSGSTKYFLLQNDIDTAGSETAIRQIVGGTSAGDAWDEWVVNGTIAYAWGIDNDDSQGFKLTSDASSSVDPSSGTTLIDITSSGEISFPSATLTENGIIIVGANGQLESLGNATNGQLPIGSTGADPVLATLTAGTGISVTNGAGSITIDASAAVATSYAADTGTATPVGNILNVVGDSSGIDTSGSGDTLTISFDVSEQGAIATTYNSDSGSATPSGNAITVSGAGGIDTSATGSTLTVTAGVTIATSYSTDSGSATPAANTINIVGGEGIDTSGATDTVTITGEDASTSNKGIASFATADFGVTAGAVDLADSVVKSVGSDSGSATPSTHAFNIVGSGGITTSGSGANITVDGSGIGGGGSWVYISTATASTSSSLDFTGIASTYDQYVFTFHDLLAASSGGEISIRTSTDNGSSYDSGSSDYWWTRLGWDGATDGSDDETDSRIRLSADGVSSASRFSGVLWLYDPSSSADYTRMQWQVTQLNASNNLFFFNGAGMRNAAEDVDAIRFLMSTGNITSGSVHMYGITKS